MNNSVFASSFKRFSSLISARGPYMPQFIKSTYCLDIRSPYKAWIHTSAPILAKITTFKLADIGEGIFEAELLKWHKNVGDLIEEMEELCEVQSDKAAVEITSRYTGKITKLHNNVGDFIKIGGPLIDIEIEGEDDVPMEKPKDTSPKMETQATSTPHSFNTSSDYHNIKASPATKKLAKDLNVDLSKIVGTGKDGRIQKSDIEDYAMNAQGDKGSEAPQAAQPSSPETKASQKSISSVPMPKYTSKENIDVPLKGFPKAMFKVMTENVKVPHLNVAEQMNITTLLKMRQTMKQVAEKEYGMNLTITPIIIKAISCCLTKFPILNSKINPSAEKYTMFGSHNVSVAIDTPAGLVVPSIKGVQDLSILQIQQELYRLQKLALSNKLSMEDLTGGTVSLSNVGVVGGTSVKALLFDGQAMIVSVGRIQKLPRFNKNGEIEAQNIIEFGYSADHRHCDGATVARFASEMKNILEEPEIMMMNM